MFSINTPTVSVVIWSFRDIYLSVRDNASVIRLLYGLNMIILRQCVKFLAWDLAQRKPLITSSHCHSPICARSVPFLLETNTSLFWSSHPLKSGMQEREGHCINCGSVKMFCYFFFFLIKVNGSIRSTLIVFYYIFT